MIHFSVLGTDGAGAEFEVAGAVEGSNPLDREVFERIGEAAFLMITNGRAHYGLPGVDGCKGPYTMQRLTCWRRQP